MPNFRGTRRVMRGRVPFDPDAEAYFEAAGISDGGEKAAANTFITGSKQAGLWTKFYRLWLFSSTSLSAAMVCARSRTSMTAVNGQTHSRSGVTFDGSTQYLDTNCTPLDSSLFSFTEGHLSVNTATAIAAGGTTQCLIGSINDGLEYFYFEHRSSAIQTYVGWSQADVGITETGLQAAFYVASRRPTISLVLYRNGISRGSNSFDPQEFAYPEDHLYIGAMNNQTVTVERHFAGRISFASLGGTLSATEVTQFNTLVSTYNRSLGRT